MLGGRLIDQLGWGAQAQCFTYMLRVVLPIKGFQLELLPYLIDHSQL